MSPITSRFGYRTEALEVVADHDLHGRTAVVTGAASGIGVETARALAAAGARVVLAVRSPERGAAARSQIIATHPHAEIEVGEMELADLSSVRRFAESFLDAHTQLHVLINNAGVMATPKDTTADGFELQFGTNHLGHFALFQELLPALRNANGARVVALSSIGHRRSDVDLDDPNYEHRDYDKWDAYGASKTACALFAVSATNKHAGDGIFANAVHPGGILTGLQQYLPLEEQRAMGWIDDDGHVNERFKSASQGASTSLWAAVGTELDGVGALYLEDCAEAVPFDPSVPYRGVMSYALDPDHADDLWTKSASLTR